VAGLFALVVIANCHLTLLCGQSAVPDPDLARGKIMFVRLSSTRRCTQAAGETAKLVREPLLIAVARGGGV